MKKIWKLAMCLLLSIGVVACSTQEDEKPTPTMVVESYIKALKAQDSKGMAAYTKSGLGEDFSIDEEDEVDMDMNKDQIQKLFDVLMSFEYTMGKERIENDSANVIVDIQAVDIVDIMENVAVLRSDDIANIVKSDSSEQEMNVKMVDIILEELAKAAKDYKEAYTFTLEKDGGDWKIDDSSDDFYAVITGGI